MCFSFRKWHVEDSKVAKRVQVCAAVSGEFAVGYFGYAGGDLPGADHEALVFRFAGVSGHRSALRHYQPATRDHQRPVLRPAGRAARQVRNKAGVDHHLADRGRDYSRPAALFQIRFPVFLRRGPTTNRRPPARRFALMFKFANIEIIEST